MTKSQVTWKRMIGFIIVVALFAVAFAYVGVTTQTTYPGFPR